MVVDRMSTLGLSFVTPAMLLWGLIAVLIPLLIHLLFRRRRRVMEWAAMRFVRHAWAARRKRIRLEQIVLLLVRCAIPVLLGLALAQPLLNDGAWFDTGPIHRYIIVDNGIASTTTDPSGRTDLDRSIEVIDRYIDTVDPGDPVSLLLSSDNTLLGPTTNTDELRRLCESIESTELPSNIHRSLERIASTIDSSTGSEVILASGLRRGTLPDGTGAPVEFPDTTSLLLGSSPVPVSPNIGILEASPGRPFVIMDSSGGERQRNTMSTSTIVQLLRDGPSYPSAVSTITIRSDGGTTSRTIRWSDGQRTRPVNMDLPIGPDGEHGSRIEIEIGPLDSVAADNTRYLSMESIEQIEILMLDRIDSGDSSGDTNWIRYALNPMNGDSIELRSIDPISVIESDLNGVDLIVVKRPDLVAGESMTLLRDHVDTGGSLLILPPPGKTIHDWARTWSDSFDLPWTWDRQDRSYDDPPSLLRSNEGVEYLSSISGELEQLLESTRIDRTMIIEPGPGTDVVLVTSDGDPFLVSTMESPRHGGSIMAFSSAMHTDWTDLPTRPLMVPLFQELLRDILSRQRSDTRHIVGDVVAGRGTGYRDSDGSVTPITRGQADGVITFETSGHWELLDESGESIQIHSVNIDRSSTSTEAVDTPLIDGLVESSTGWRRFTDTPGSIGSVMDAGSSMTRFLLFLLLATLVSETVMSRFFTHSRFVTNGVDRP